MRKLYRMSRFYANLKCVLDICFVYEHLKILDTSLLQNLVY